MLGIVGTLLIPTLRKKRQVDLCEFEASLVYRLSSRTAWPIQNNSASKNETKQKQKQFLKIEGKVESYRMVTRE